jgi:hypothetical protein
MPRDFNGIKKMNWRLDTEAAQFPEKEYITGIFVEVNYSL